MRSTQIELSRTLENSIAHLWAYHSVLAERATDICAALPLLPQANHSNVSNYLDAVNKYEGELKYVRQRVLLLKSTKIPYTARGVYRSLLYLAIVIDSAHAHLQSLVRPSISSLEMQPYIPDNSYSTSIRNLVSILYRLFDFDSFPPCLMPITVAALAYRDSTVLGLLTKYQKYRPDLVQPYVGLLSPALPASRTPLDFTVNHIPDAESNPWPQIRLLAPVFPANILAHCSKTVRELSDGGDL